MAATTAKVISAATVCLVIFSLIIQTCARPKDGPTQNSLNSQLRGCKMDIKVQETCQRCAKVTKSNVVYPMCCANEDEVFVWCEKYIGYGIH